MEEINKFLLRLGDYHIKNINDEAASQEQVYVLWSFMNILTPSKFKTMFARGESDSNLQKHYLADTTNIRYLLDMIFCVGEKGRVCFDNDDWIDPDDTDIGNFARICTLLNSALKSAAKGTPERVNRMHKFIQKNKTFSDAFLLAKENLIKRYEKLCSEDRTKVNLYYLAILHTINSNRYKDKSVFVSTSRDFEVAEQFEQSLMFIGWMPKAHFPAYVASKKMDSFTSVCDSVGLPFVSIPVYPEQAEISVRYGILPHFIIGVKIKNVFYVNPALYETMELFKDCTSIMQMKQLRADIIRNGLKVNQERFLEYCRKSGYLRYFTYDGIQYRINSLS